MASKAQAKSKGKTEPDTDAITLLETDHRTVEELFGTFERARSPERKRSLADEICTALKVHTALEEEIFYPACREGGVQEEDLAEAQVEHDSAKALIAEIEAGGPDDDLWEAKVKVLAEQIEHHVQEEEEKGEGLFAQARKAKLDLQALGARMAARKAELEEEE